MFTNFGKNIKNNIEVSFEKPKILVFYIFSLVMSPFMVARFFDYSKNLTT